MTHYDADLDAIKGLRAALETFAAQQVDALAAAEIEIAAAVTALDQAAERWRAKIEQRQQELRNCHALQLVMGSDCSAEAVALRDAEEKLSEIMRLQMQMQDVLGVYRAAGERFSSVLENELPQARVYLNDRITALEAYAATRVSPTNGASTHGVAQADPRTSKQKG
jgi:hypothetical protein